MVDYAVHIRYECVCVRKEESPRAPSGDLVLWLRGALPSTVLRWPQKRECVRAGFAGTSCFSDTRRTSSAFQHLQMQQ